MYFSWLTASSFIFMWEQFIGWNSALKQTGCSPHADETGEFTVIWKDAERKNTRPEVLSISSWMAAVAPPADILFPLSAGFSNSCVTLTNQALYCLGISLASAQSTPGTQTRSQSPPCLILNNWFLTLSRSRKLWDNNTQLFHPCTVSGKTRGNSLKEKKKKKSEMKRGQSQRRANMRESRMATVPGLGRNQNKSISSPTWRPHRPVRRCWFWSSWRYSASTPGLVRCSGPRVMLPDRFPAGPKRKTLLTLALIHRQQQQWPQVRHPISYNGVTVVLYFNFMLLAHWLICIHMCLRANKLTSCYI